MVSLCLFDLLGEVYLIFEVVTSRAAHARAVIDAIESASYEAERIS